VERVRLGINEPASREVLYFGTPEKAKSIVFTEGLQQAERLLEKLFSEGNARGAGQPSGHVYAIVRFDRAVQLPENSFAVKAIVSTQAITESEVKRLNELSADNNYRTRIRGV
jgi:hypothetical protein